jgi:hypothetical protein
MTKPCKLEQERNPETNRCRKVCKNGTIRNAQGRCVKKLKEIKIEKPKNQTKLSDYYKVSRIRRTYKRKPKPKPSVQTELDRYFNR